MNHGIAPSRPVLGARREDRLMTAVGRSAHPRAEYEGESPPIQFAFQLDEYSGTLRRLDIPHNDLRLGGNSWGPNTYQAL